MSKTLYLSIVSGPHDSARGDTTLLRVRGVHVANKYAMVDCGLFDSTIRTDLAPIVFEYTDWAFVLARSAAERPQAGLCDICIRKYEWDIF
jgi:hypothetical protein